MDKKTKRIQRKIYFYKIVCLKNGKEIEMKSIFDKYITMLDNNFNELEERDIAIPYFDKYQVLEIDKIKNDENSYKGKFFSLRLTDFPYIFNLIDGERTEISYSDSDTLMEQTHFYCFANKRLIVSEYNFYGARIEQLGNYLVKVMEKIEPSIRYEISIAPIVILEYFKQIENCTSVSKVQFKVAHAGLEILKKNGVIHTCDIAKEQLSETSDYYIDIEISGGGRGKTLKLKDTKIFLKNIISSIISIQSKENNENNIIKKAKINAYNINEHRNIPYDLLDEKLMFSCSVEKISDKNKYVDSDKMYENILVAYQEKNQEALRYIGLVTNAD